MRVLVLAAIALATSAEAEPGETLDVSIDSQPVDYEIQSEYSEWAGYLDTLEFSIVARTSDDRAPARTLMVSFRVTGLEDLTNASVDSQEIIFVGSEATFLASDDTGAQIEVTSYRKDGDEVTLSGSFQAVPTFTEDYGRTFDESRTISVDGSFDVTFAPLE